MKLQIQTRCGSGTDSQCCIDCHQQGMMRCSMPGDVAPILSGQCVLGECVAGGCGARSDQDGSICDEPGYFDPYYTSRCQHICPYATVNPSQCNAMSLAAWPPGARCQTEDGEGGSCVPLPEPIDDDWNWIYQECVPDSQTQYSWSIVMASVCNCNQDPQLATQTAFRYVCTSDAGVAVAESFCEAKGVTKPSAPQCCCDGSCETPGEVEPKPDTDNPNQPKPILLLVAIAFVFVLSTILQVVVA